MRKIKIFDTTLRDGEQSAGINLNVAEKVKIAKQLARLQVDIIEAGFAIASPGDFEAIQTIAREVPGVTVCSLARAMQADIDRAWEALKEAEDPLIHTFIATSEIHMQYKLNKEPDQVIAMAVAAVEYARGRCPKVEFSAEDATRSDWDFLCKIFSAVIKAGATALNVPDTVGYATPSEFGRLIAYLKKNVAGIDQVTLSVHCHNDLGLAVANSLAAVENGADQVECTINGLGERAGNAALEEVVMALRTRGENFQGVTGIETEQIYRSSQLVSALTGKPVQHNKAIVGANAFAHEAGIHQDGMLKNRMTYEIITPESIGLSQSQIVLGKHSGRHAVKNRVVELGYTLTEAEHERVYRQFIELADKKKEVTDTDLEALVGNEGQSGAKEYELDYVQVSTGNRTIPTATVRLNHKEKLHQEAACGDGPVDAAYKAIDRIINRPVVLKDYTIRAISSGEDALGEVSVKLADAESSFVGRGLSTDIIEASVLAYLNALNKLVQSS